MHIHIALPRPEVPVTQQRLLGKGGQPIAQAPPNPDVCDFRPQHWELNSIFFSISGWVLLLPVPVLYVEVKETRPTA